MRIEVTQNDIDKGCEKDCLKCPVALAINRVLRKPYVCYVDIPLIRIRKGRSLDFVCEILTPEVAIDFIRAFDPGRDVSPFSFDLSIPEEYVAELNAV
ncbi:MAG: hypothetical protein L0Z50_20935 [Verrucomicrobiales bacterium]|nr:hypothetical protein [Verrucomicrobiales bacterium]